MSKFEVVLIGDAFQDLFVFSNDFKVVRDRGFKSGKSLSFDYGAKNVIDKMIYSTGGSAVNSAVSFARLGYSCGVSTFIGQDSAGDKLIRIFEEEGIEFIGKLSEHETNTSIILSCNGDRTILSYHGDDDYGDLNIGKTLDVGWFYLAPIGRDFEQLENKIVENIAKNGAGLIWNPGVMQIRKKAREFKHLLRLCNIIILNREEALEFASRGTAEDAMFALSDLGVKIVVVTDGKNGSKLYDGRNYYKIDVSDDERVDATGAGDAFGSTFSARVIKNCAVKPTVFVPERDDINEALKWAVVNSGSVVSQIGANLGLLSSSKIEEKVKKLVKLEPTIYNK